MRCSRCKDIYHGTCLKFDKDTIFILQQFKWHCMPCFINESVNYSCATCLGNINVFQDKITQCKQCHKILHKNCSQSNVCLACLPLPFLQLNNSCSETIENDFYSDQPYFAPFEFYCNEVIDFVPDAEQLNDNLQYCSEILRQCDYYKCDDFLKLDRKGFLTFIGLNVDGFRTNFDSFAIHHEKFSADGYFLCESNVTEEEASRFYLPNYNKFVSNRILKSDGRLKHKGSGLVIFLREDFVNASIITELSMISTDFEVLCVEINLRGERILVLCCYRPPSGNFELFIDLLNDLLARCNDKKNKKCYILGDFNVNIYNSSSSSTRKYLDCLFSNNFLPIISRATHFGGLNGTCIDHILTNDLSKVVNNGIIRCNISRHLPTFTMLDFNLDPNVSNKPKTRVKVNDYLLNNFIAEFNSLNFDIAGETAEFNYSYFHENFRALYDKWFINSRTTSKNSILRSDWISLGLAKSSDVKNMLYDNWVQHKSRCNWNKYIDYKRVFETIKNKAKYDYYDRCFKSNQSDLKKTWKLINGLLGRKRSNRLLAFPNSDAAHNFNSYFINIASDLISKTYGNDLQEDMEFKKYLPERQADELCDISFTSNQIIGIITKLNNSKGTYFSPRILKLLAPTISPILAELFNKCVIDGYFPHELKVAKVIPLYKNKGLNTDLSNYRPISMLPVFSKIFEKLLHREINDFLDKNKLLNNSQFGFRSKHSTVHALINAVENLHTAIDDKNFTLGIFIDFSKAFDTINHDILLVKLDSYGIRGNVHKLLASYLSERHQYVSYGGLDSSLLKITCGVPQGSVLGPLLFIIFINDIVNISDLAKFVLFADDLNLFLANRDRDLLYIDANQILFKIYEYCFANKLIMNFDKCCFIEFNNSKTKEEKFLGVLNIPFKQVVKCKFLGVIINSNLSWDDQISNVITQVSKSCGSLYSLRSVVPTKVLRQVYLSLVQPYLSYCIPLWGAVTNSYMMQKLFILQKKCIRIVGNKTEKKDGIFQHTKPIFFRFNILTLFNLYYYFTGCLAMRILTTHVPVNIMQMFKVSERSYRLIFPKFSHTKIKNNSFVFNSSKILNYLLDHAIPYYILSDTVFKHRFKSHLINIQNLSLEGDDNWLPCNHDLFSNISV